MTRQRAQTTVLVVEDDDLLRETIEVLLGRKGRTVLVAHDAPGALATARRHPDPIDLLVTDLALAGGDGLALASELESRSRGLKILFISGYPVAAAQAAALRGEGRGFIAKPFTPAALEGAVAALLGG